MVVVTIKESRMVVVTIKKVEYTISDGSGKYKESRIYNI